MSSELIKYIKKQLDQGADREQLITHIVGHGWSEEVVRDLMDDVIETPSPAPLRKLALPSLTLIGLVVILGFMISNNNITGSAVSDMNEVCLYKHGEVIEKMESCCIESRLASNCRKIASAYTINNDYMQFNYNCDYKDGTLILNKELINSC